MQHATIKEGEAVSFMEATTDEAIIQAKRLCQDVYIHAGYIAASCSAEAVSAERNEGNAYIIAKDEHEQVIGTIRLSTSQACRTFSIWQGKLYHQCAWLISAAQQGPSFEIGALAVRKDYAHLKVSWGLYSFAYRWALAHGMNYGIISMDVRAFRALALVGWRAVPIGAPMHYLGSLTVPAIIPINSQPAIVSAKTQAWFQNSSAQLPGL